jgi:hypothetical protein
VSTEIEDRVALSLRDRADRDVDTDTLLTGAVRRGRRRLVRQRVSWLGVIAVLVAGTVTFGVLRPYPVIGRHTAASPWNDLTPRSLDDTLMPPAAPAGSRTALQDPAAVGGDPGLLHLSVGPLPGHYVSASWATGSGEENVVLADADEAARVRAGSSPVDQDVMISLTTGPDDGTHGATIVGAGPTVLDGTFTLGGATVSDYLVPGGKEADTRLLRWQPAPGLLVQVTTAADDRKARLIAAAVRLDTVHRCVVPFRLTQPPTGTATACQLTFSLTPVPLATTIEGASGSGTSYTLIHGADRMFVETKQYTGTGNPCGVTDGTLRPPSFSTVQLDSGTGRAYAHWESVPDASHLEACQPIGGMVVSVTTVGASYTTADAVRVVNGLRPAGQLDRPDTWPASPLL